MFVTYLLSQKQEKGGLIFFINHNLFSIDYYDFLR